LGMMNSALASEAEYRASSSPKGASFTVATQSFSSGTNRRTSPPSMWETRPTSTGSSWEDLDCAQAPGAAPHKKTRPMKILKMVHLHCLIESLLSFKASHVIQGPRSLQPGRSPEDSSSRSSPSSSCLHPFAPSGVDRPSRKCSAYPLGDRQGAIGGSRVKATSIPSGATQENNRLPGGFPTLPLPSSTNSAHPVTIVAQ